MLPEVNIIIDTFLSMWREREEYCGTLLTGSFATGTHNTSSDIDLRLVLEPGAGYREMGECVIMERAVSFLVLPADEYLQAFEEDLSTSSKFEINRFLVGKIIEDKHETVKNLCRVAREASEKNLIGLSPVATLYEKIKLNRDFKIFLEMPAVDPFFEMTYWLLIKDLTEFFAKFLQAELPGYTKKWSRFFEQATYRQANAFTEFPDNEFTQKLMIACRSTNRASISDLYRYVINATGGLQDTNFLMRHFPASEEAELYAFGE